MIGRHGEVRLVNRIIDEHGQRVPQEYMFSGEAVVIQDVLDVEVGIARILIHQSMYKIDPVDGSSKYKLGCEKLETPTGDIPVADIDRIELIDRDLLPESQRRKMKYEHLHNPINPNMSRGPLAIKGNVDGSQPGEFGYRD
jgi:hypothetical protein